MKHDSLNGIGYYKDKLGTERWPQMWRPAVVFYEEISLKTTYGH